MEWVVPFKVNRVNVKQLADFAKEDIPCSICREEYLLQEETAQTPCCRLLMHLSCFMSWVNTMPEGSLSEWDSEWFSCPKCRNWFSRQNVLEGYEALYPRQRSRAVKVEDEASVDGSDHTMAEPLADDVAEVPVVSETDSSNVPEVDNWSVAPLLPGSYDCKRYGRRLRKRMKDLLSGRRLNCRLSTRDYCHKGEKSL